MGLKNASRKELINGCALYVVLGTFMSLVYYFISEYFELPPVEFVFNQCRYKPTKSPLL